MLKLIEKLINKIILVNQFKEFGLMILYISIQIVDD